MQLIYPSLEITFPDYRDTLLICASASALCYNKQISAEIGTDELENYVKARLDAHHDSIAEHGHISVEFTCDRGITHELVRHRLCSFTQSSTRFIDCCSGKNEATFIIPSWCKNVRPGHYTATTFVNAWDDKAEAIWFDQMLTTSMDYDKLREAGWTPEKARSILPNSLAAKIRVTANIREWRHIINLRAKGTTGRPHPQMLQLMLPLWCTFHEAMPVFFEPCQMSYKDIDDYGIGNVQIIANTGGIPTSASMEFPL